MAWPDGQKKISHKLNVIRYEFVVCVCHSVAITNVLPFEYGLRCRGRKNKHTKPQSQLLRFCVSVSLPLCPIHCTDSARESFPIGIGIEMRNAHTSVMSYDIPHRQKNITIIHVICFGFDERAIKRRSPSYSRTTQNLRYESHAAVAAQTIA